MYWSDEMCSYIYILNMNYGFIWFNILLISLDFIFLFRCRFDSGLSEIIFFLN